MQCKQAHEYAHIKYNQSKFMSLLPLLVCFSCSRILILSHPSMLLPFFVYVHVQSLLLCLYFFVSIFPKTFISLYNLSPFLVIDDNSTKIWKLSSFGFMLLAQEILPCANDFWTSTTNPKW